VPLPNLLLIFLAGLYGAAYSHAASPGDTAPSRDQQLLDRRYDQVAHLMTHNAMSNRAEGWLFPNQSHGLTHQLNAGVRGLMLDVHTVNGQPYLVHNKPLLGKRPLVEGLREIARFMKSHPQSILTIIFESYVPAKSVQQAFRDAQLLDSLHQQQHQVPWPTLRQMIRNGKRLVVFTDRGGGEWPGYHGVWTFCQETHFSVKKVADFSYRRNRGQASNRLMILNHFLTNPVATTRLAQQANRSDVLLPRLRSCLAEAERYPNFIVVDFYEIGDTPKTVDQFNRRSGESP
jgi:hypothetical protein